MFWFFSSLLVAADAGQSCSSRDATILADFEPAPFSPFAKFARSPPCRVKLSRLDDENPDALDVGLGVEFGHSPLDARVFTLRSARLHQVQKGAHGHNGHNGHNRVDAVLEMAFQQIPPDEMIQKAKEQLDGARANFQHAVRSGHGDVDVSKHQAMLSEGIVQDWTQRGKVLNHSQSMALSFNQMLTRTKTSWSELQQLSEDCSSKLEKILREIADDRFPWKRKPGSLTAPFSASRKVILTAKKRLQTSLSDARVGISQGEKRLAQEIQEMRKGVSDLNKQLNDTTNRGLYNEVEDLGFKIQQAQRDLNEKQSKGKQSRKDALSARSYLSRLVDSMQTSQSDFAETVSQLHRLLRQDNTYNRMIADLVESSERLLQLCDQDAAAKAHIRNCSQNFLSSLKQLFSTNPAPHMLPPSSDCEELNELQIVAQVQQHWKEHVRLEHDLLDQAIHAPLLVQHLKLQIPLQVNPHGEGMTISGQGDELRAAAAAAMSLSHVLSKSSVSGFVDVPLDLKSQGIPTSPTMVVQALVPVEVASVDVFPGTGLLDAAQPCWLPLPHEAAIPAKIETGAFQPLYFPKSPAEAQKENTWFAILAAFGLLFWMSFLAFVEWLCKSKLDVTTAPPESWTLLPVSAREEKDPQELNKRDMEHDLTGLWLSTAPVLFALHMAALIGSTWLGGCYNACMSGYPWWPHYIYGLIQLILRLMEIEFYRRLTGPGLGLGQVLFDSVMGCLGSMDFYTDLSFIVVARSCNGLVFLFGWEIWQLGLFCFVCGVGLGQVLLPAIWAVQQPAQRNIIFMKLLNFDLLADAYYPYDIGDKGYKKTKAVVSLLLAIIRFLFEDFPQFYIQWTFKSSVGGGSFVLFSLAVSFLASGGGLAKAGWDVWTTRNEVAKAEPGGQALHAILELFLFRRLKRRLPVAEASIWTVYWEGDMVAAESFQFQPNGDGKLRLSPNCYLDIKGAKLNAEKSSMVKLMYAKEAAIYHRGEKVTSRQEWNLPFEENLLKWAVSLQAYKCPEVDIRPLKGLADPTASSGTTEELQQVVHVVCSLKECERRLIDFGLVRTLAEKILNPERVGFSFLSFRCQALEELASNSAYLEVLLKCNALGVLARDSESASQQDQRDQALAVLRSLVVLGKGQKKKLLTSTSPIPPLMRLWAKLSELPKAEADRATLEVLTCLQALAADEDGARGMIHVPNAPRYCELAEKALKSCQVEVQRSILGTLKILCSKWVLHQTSQVLGCLSELGPKPLDSRVQADAAYVLHSLTFEASDAEKLEIVKNHNISKQLALMLRDRGEQGDKTKLEAASAVRNLAFTEECRDDLLEMGVLKPLVALLGQDQNMALQAASALQSLACGKWERVEKILAAKAVEPLKNISTVSRASGAAKAALQNLGIP